MGSPQTYITGVVNEPRLVTRHGSINNVVFIDSEHVGAKTLKEMEETVKAHSEVFKTA